MREEIGEIYNGPTRHGPIIAGNPDVEKTGRFTAAVKGTHSHNWIFGEISAVCTKCGYTVPKSAKLPAQGLWNGKEGA